MGRADCCKPALTAFARCVGERLHLSLDCRKLRNQGCFWRHLETECQAFSLPTIMQ
jgi:hypothetical protein